MKNIILIIAILFSISSFSNDKNYISSHDSAKLVGEAFLVSIYGKEILKQRPFKISSSSATWILEGTFHCPKNEVCLGGVAYIEFNKSDAKIIKVIHGK